MTPPAVAAPGRAQAERHALVQSIRITAVLAALGVVWGIAVGSQMILFDGVYAVVGIGLSWLLLKASALAATVQAPVLDVLAEVRRDFGLGEPRARTALRRRLDELPFDVWLTFEMRAAPDPTT